MTATDKAGEAISRRVVLTVENVNEAPVFQTRDFLVAMEGVAFSVDVSDWFADPDLHVPGSTEVLTYAVTLRGGFALPNWLVLNETTGALTIAAGATDDAEIGDYILAVTATDKAGAEAFHTARFTVENVNEAPMVDASEAETELSVLEEKSAYWDVSDWFSDEDTDDLLVYTGVLANGVNLPLPDWLTLYWSSGVLEIAAMATDDEHVGFYTLVVTAWDNMALTASHTATLTIEDDTKEPYLSVALSTQILPVGTLNLTLTLTDFFADLQEDGQTVTQPGQFTFAVSDSIQGTGAENIVTARIAPGGTWLILEPGAAKDKLWQQETVTLTATDNDGKRDIVEFAVTSRGNVLDTTYLIPAHGFIIQGDAVFDLLGDSVSGAGDINGDGIDDLIVGADGSDDGGMNAGEAYIIYGKAGTGSQFGTKVGDRQVLDTSSSSDLAPADGFIIRGDAAYDLLGVSVSGAGDINGDGIDDLIVGADGSDDGGMNAGEAYIIYGKAGTGSQFGTKVGDRQVLDTSSSSDLAPADGFILRGDAANDRLGDSVSGAGDINGDGLADLIVGAYWGDDGGRDAGEAYIIYGKAGTGDGTQFGTAVRVRESDGSTVTDGTTKGTVLRQVLDTSFLKPADGFIIQGDAVIDYLGVSVSGAGDINGDGLADLIVGAYEGNDGGDDAGEAYIIYGKAGTDGTGSQFGTKVGDRQVLDTTDLKPADGFIIQGDAGDELGISVSGAGDINGDGLADLIVGAPEGDDGGTNAGEAYIIYGKAGTGDGSQFGTKVGDRQVLDTSFLKPADGFIIQGDAVVDELGRVSGAGDINGDGLADLIVGAKSGDDGGGNAGEAYIIYGKAGTNGAQFGTKVEDRQVLDTTNLKPADGFIIQGDAAGDNLGGCGFGRRRHQWRRVRRPHRRSSIRR